MGRTPRGGVGRRRVAGAEVSKDLVDHRRLGNSAQAQRTDFTTTPGVFTAPNLNNFIAAGVWDYAPGIGWAVNGRSGETATLLSGLFSATSGTVGISFDHTLNFELRLFGGCFDGGLLLASIDGGAFSPITAMTGGSGYRGAITTTGGSARDRMRSAAFRTTRKAQWSKAASSRRWQQARRCSSPSRAPIGAMTGQPVHVRVVSFEWSEPRRVATDRPRGDAPL